MRATQEYTNVTSAADPVRQGEIASLAAELAAAVQENASFITRLYELAKRLGGPPPQTPFPPVPEGIPVGQLGELRDSVGRLRRENNSFAAVVEVLETL